MSVHDLIEGMDLSSNQRNEMFIAYDENPQGFERIAKRAAGANNPTAALIAMVRKGQHTVIPTSTVKPRERYEAPEVVLADPDIADRWKKIEHLVRTVPIAHEWRCLHRELVTAPLLEAYVRGEEWQVPDEGIGILVTLEVEAERLGIAAPTAAPLTLAERLLATLEEGKAA